MSATVIDLPTRAATQLDTPRPLLAALIQQRAEAAAQRAAQDVLDLARLVADARATRRLAAELREVRRLWRARVPRDCNHGLDRDLRDAIVSLNRALATMAREARA